MSKIKKSIGATLLGVTLALVGAAGLVGTAQARTYPGVFTPPFGPPLDDLEWSGSGDFFIPDACEALPAGWQANFGPTCGGMSITNGKLVFSSLSSSFTDEVFTFAPPTVNEMYVSGGELRGVYSEFIGQFMSTNFTHVGGTPIWFWLRFEREIAVGPNRSVVQLYFNKVGEGSECLIRRDCEVWGESHEKAILILVPEPSTYALMAAGLLAVGFIARRRRNAA